jgi:hypothetical protein
MGSKPKPEHDTWDEFMDMERSRLQQHASGKLAEALGHALPGESQEELARIAAEDQRLAQQGMVKLKVGGEIHYKHIDELTREDRMARIEAEREEVEWLKRRLGLQKERNRQEATSYGRSPEDA